METRDRRKLPQRQQRHQQVKLALLDRSRLEINEDTRLQAVELLAELLVQVSLGEVGHEQK
jgi:hypothetical protein